MPMSRATKMLQGSIKRKLEDDSSPVSSGINDIIFSSDNKRLCLDDVTLPMGQSQSASSSVPCSDLQHSPFSTNHSTSSMGVGGHQVLLENNHMNGRGMASPFSNTDMSQKVTYEEKNPNLQSVDQELQDLLEELTKMPDPSPNDLDLENILAGKPDEPLVMSHSQPNLSTTPKLSPAQSSHLDNHISNKDFSGGCSSANAGSPQIRPSSAGTNYPIASSSKPVQSPIPASQSKSQSQAMLPGSMANMPGTNWHAQQLKQLAANKQVPPGKQQVPTPNWPTISPTGLSPPYRPGSSPQQPFSPQNVMVPSMSTGNLQGNAIQGSQNAMLSSMPSTNNPSNRPSPPYVAEKIASPALNQQPFSPQNSLLQNITTSNIPANTIKSPQNNMVPSMTPANAGPSPPYQPEKLSSPALHQQPFSPQNTLMSSLTPTGSQSSLQNSLFKSMTTNQPKNMNMIMQQPSNGLQSAIVNDNSGGHDQFSFNNTKPLSHFAPDSGNQKMNLSSNPGSLIHYLQQQQQQQQPQHQPATVQQNPQVSNNQFLQQQIRQLMQPSRMQRQMQTSGLPPQSRQDPNVGIVPRMQEPGSIPSAGPGPTPLTANGYIRNAILKEQIMRRQQVKPRPNMMSMTSEQRSAFVAQQMNQFQNIPQSLRTDCVQPMPTPPQAHRIITSTQGMIQTNMGAGITPTTMNQNSGSMVMMNTGKQQGIFPASSDFSMPLRQNQNALSMTAGYQTVHSQPNVRPGMALSGGHTTSSLINHSAAQQHLRQSNISRIPNVYASPPSQMWTQSGVSRLTGQSQMDPSLQQFSNNPLFTKQNVRPNMTSQQFSHQGVVPPNQIAPGVQIRQMQKLSLTQANQGVGSLNNPNIVTSLSRGQIAALNAMKAMPQGLSTFNQMNPGQLGPPSYGPTSVQTPETFDRINTGAEMHQYDFVAAQNSSVLSANCNEADFIDCLMKGGGGSSNDEDWLNNLTILDDILGQHNQNSGPV
ncbi:mastermind-like domain-containing protein 1 isoform X2 [Phyllobates terribilis]|uniref:mastermind-like domain-containing protein 1 isoform X2 n=1 Tax=Phyllobates terribilis TaxID=111132 RepID=UPI003CCB4591